MALRVDVAVTDCVSGEGIADDVAVADDVRLRDMELEILGQNAGRMPTAHPREPGSGLNPFPHRLQLSTLYRTVGEVHEVIWLRGKPL